MRLPLGSRSRFLALAALLVLVAASARAQATFGLIKAEQFQQTGSGVPVAAPVDAFVFSGLASSPGSLTSPAGQSYTLAFDSGDQFYEYDGSFTSKAALDAAFPSGAYTFSVSGDSAQNLQLAADLYPPIPQLIDGAWISNGFLLLDSTVDSLITFSPFTTYSTAGEAGQLSVEIGDVNGNVVYSNSWSTFDTPVAPSSFTIPSYTLLPGQSYFLNIAFETYPTISLVTSPEQAELIAGYGRSTVVEVATQPAPVSPTGSPSRLVNLSARASVGTGGNILIAGFVVQGSQPKAMVIRGAGPVLANAPYNVAGTLASPVLTLFNGSQVQIDANSGWADSPTLAAAFAQVGAFAYPQGSADTALFETALPGGAAYTAQVSGASNTTGVALAEVYDADTTFTASSSRLVNLSARAQVGTGGNILIAGFVITGDSPETVLIRGIGPTLAGAPYNVAGTLASPVLTLFDSAGNVITTDQGWQNAPSAPTGPWAGVLLPADASAQNFQSVGAFSLVNGSADCALVVTLPAGAYTAQVAGANGTTGVALVEVYEVPQ